MPQKKYSNTCSKRVKMLRAGMDMAQVDLAADEGTFYVQDVYAGQQMAEVRRGSAKYLRIVEAPPKKTFPPDEVAERS